MDELIRLNGDSEKFDKTRKKGLYDNELIFVFKKQLTGFTPIGLFLFARFGCTRAQKN